MIHSFIMLAFLSLAAGSQKNLLYSNHVHVKPTSQIISRLKLIKLMLATLAQIPCVGTHDKYFCYKFLAYHIINSPLTLCSARLVYQRIIYLNLAAFLR